MPDHFDDDDQTKASGPNAKTWLLGAAIVAVLVLFVVLHLTGVLGPSNH